MVCNDYRELLSAYIDEVLSEQEKEQLEEHLHACTSCRQELAELKYTVSLVRDMAEISAPQALVPKVINVLEKEHSKSKFKWRGWHLGQVASVAGILLVAVGLGLVTLSKGVGLHSYGVASKSDQLITGAPRGQVQTEQSMVAQGTMEMADGASKEKALVMGKAVADQAMSNRGEAGRERKVIKQASLNLEVPDVNVAYNKLIQKAENLGGFVESSSMSNETLPDGRVIPNSSTMVLRVPSTNFGEFLGFSEGTGKVLFKELTGQDVSTEFYDTETRVQNYKEQEVRLREILNQAKNVEEILKVETELQRVRGEIEVMEGRLRQLTNLTDLGTLTVNLVKAQSSAIEAPPATNLWERTKEAFVISVNELLKDIGNLVVSLGQVLPQLLVTVVLAGLGYLGYRVIRK